jgi:hypothetical protein
MEMAKQAWVETEAQAVAYEADRVNEDVRIVFDMDKITSGTDEYGRPYLTLKGVDQAWAPCALIQPELVEWMDKQGLNAGKLEDMIFTEIKKQQVSKLILDAIVG